MQLETLYGLILLVIAALYAISVVSFSVVAYLLMKNAKMRDARRWEILLRAIENSSSTNEAQSSEMRWLAESVRDMRRKS